MNYSPTTNPTICQGNTMTIADTVRSYYNTYRYYKWQRSTDGGATWIDIPGETGTGAPTWNGSSWQYVTTYTLTPAQTQLANDGDLYRVVVGTTAANVLNPTCNFTDGIAIITLNIINCGPPLDIHLLSFNGKMQNTRAALAWSTSKEGEPVLFDVERSSDGTNFFRIGTVNGHNNSNTNNVYRFIDTSLITGKTFYRVGLQTAGGKRKLSHTIVLQGEADDFSIGRLVNPFTSSLSFDLTTGDEGRLEMVVMDAGGQQLIKKIRSVYSGLNSIVVEKAGLLPAGVYILQLQYKGKIIIKKIVRQ